MNSKRRSSCSKTQWIKLQSAMGSKNVQNCVTSFMDDPISKKMHRLIFVSTREIIKMLKKQMKMRVHENGCLSCVASTTTTTTTSTTRGSLMRSFYVRVTQTLISHGLFTVLHILANFIRTECVRDWDKLNLG